MPQEEALNEYQAVAADGANAPPLNRGVRRTEAMMPA